MSRLAGYLFACLFLFDASSGFAQDGRQILQGIIGGAFNGMQQHQLQQQQQQQQQQLLQQLMPYWESCNKGDIESCDRAAQFPLNQQDRFQIDQMRQNAVLKQAFLEQWRGCFDAQNVAACRSALAYPYLVDVDRQQILTKQQQLLDDEERKRQALREEEERRRQALREEEERQRQALREEEERKRQLFRQEQERRRLENERLQAQIQAEQAKRQAELEEKTRAAHRNAMAVVREPCLKRDEAACIRGLNMAVEAQEKAEFVNLLEVAQSPLGIPALKPLKDIPLSTVVMSGISALLAMLLLLLYRKRSTSTLASQFSGAASQFGSSAKQFGSSAKQALTSLQAQLRSAPAPSPSTATAALPMQMQTPPPVTPGAPVVDWISPDKARLALIIGIAGVVISFLWWLIFYTGFIRATGGGPEDLKQVFSCLFYTSGVCALVKVGASYAGYWPYEPMFLWLSAALCVIGGLNIGSRSAPQSGEVTPPVVADSPPANGEAAYNGMSSPPA